MAHEKKKSYRLRNPVVAYGPRSLPSQTGDLLFLFAIYWEIPHKRNQTKVLSVNERLAFRYFTRLDRSRRCGGPERKTVVGLTSLITRNPPMPTKINRRRALFVLTQIDQLLAWEERKEIERDTKPDSACRGHGSSSLMRGGVRSAERPLFPGLDLKLGWILANWK
jgi:hypothetical protein